MNGSKNREGQIRWRRYDWLTVPAFSLAAGSRRALARELASSNLLAQRLDAICVRSVRAFDGEAAGRTAWLWIEQAPTAAR